MKCTEKPGYVRPGFFSYPLDYNHKENQPLFLNERLAYRSYYYSSSRSGFSSKSAETGKSIETICLPSKMVK
jgi:hypothetical protein